MDSTIVEGSRSCAADTTLEHAKHLSAAAGISEVYEITHQDRLEVPVFVSVRPRARADVCTFGKGLLRVEAEVGAYMEALEYYFAEPGVGRVTTHWGTARDVAGSAEAVDAILDFAPLLQRATDLDAPLLLAEVADLETGQAGALPAELIDYPSRNTGPALFGASTNGLASGNSLLEASLHALLELIERDIWSLEIVRRASILVEASSLPDEVCQIAERAARAGLGLKVRTVPNDYGIPFFAAFVFDERLPRRETFNGGWACDLDGRRALIRAVTEAAQSRLAFIHGGRQVPRRRSAGPASDVQQQESHLVRQHIRGVSDARRQVSMSDIPDLAVSGPLTRRLATVIECLRRVSQKPIYRAVYTPPDAALHVVRLVVPLLENLKESKVRVGRRLKAAIDANGAQAG
jgi:ribosomal protein S12 methylthiotransferase accessory factor